MPSHMHGHAETDAGSHVGASPKLTACRDAREGVGVVREGVGVVREGVGVVWAAAAGRVA